MKETQFDLNGKTWTVEGETESICISPQTWDNPADYQWVWWHGPEIIGVVDSEGLNFCDASEEAKALEWCFENPELFEI